VGADGTPDDRGHASVLSPGELATDEHVVVEDA
jgi:hypothetical protein